MKKTFTKILSRLTLAVLLATKITGALATAQVGKSPWGPEDEIGRLNLMTTESQSAILSRVSGGAVYDLSVEYFIGMPSWQAAGDPHYQIWMTHTPHGTVTDDPLSVGVKMKVYEFAFIGGSLKLRGSDAAPMRPIVIPLHSKDKKVSHD